MNLTLYSPPATEPLTRSEVKQHLRIDDVADSFTVAQCIAPGSHAIAASYTLLGASVDVSSSSATVVLNSGTNGASGTVSCKLQDSNNGSTWTDVTSGAFTTVTTANDNATYQIAYTGQKHYLRVVATVAVAACVFSVDIHLASFTTVENSYLDGLTASARQYAEVVQHRALITQTWDMSLDGFCDWQIKLPLAPVISVTSIEYIDAAGDEQTLDSSLYQVAIGTPGRIVPTYGYCWPTTRAQPGAVSIRFVAGYGAAASVPATTKTAMLLLIAHWYRNREAVVVGTIAGALPMAVESLLALDCWGSL